MDGHPEEDEWPKERQGMRDEISGARYCQLFPLNTQSAELAYVIAPGSEDRISGIRIRGSQKVA